MLIILSSYGRFAQERFFYPFFFGGIFIAVVVAFSYRVVL